MKDTSVVKTKYEAVRDRLVEMRQSAYFATARDTLALAERAILQLERDQLDPDEIERLRLGHQRYEIARRMNPRQWADAWKLNLSTGKPFDEIIDDLGPFVLPK